MASVVGLAGVPAADAAVAKPSVTRVSPNVGPVKGTTRVTVSGANFVRVSAVTFGGVRGTGIRVATGGRSLSVTAPKHAAGTVDVRVVTRAGTSAVSARDRFTYRGVPTVTAVSPRAGMGDGVDRQLAITGTNFYDVTSVSVDGVKVGHFRTASSTRIEDVRLPAHPAATVSVSVATKWGTVTKAGAYRFLGSFDVGNTVDPAQGNVNRVSCASDGYCMALDAFNHTATRAAGAAAWSDPSTVTAAPGETIGNVQCIAADNCIAAGSSVFRWNGTAWTAVTFSAGPIANLACAPGTAFCIAQLYDGSTVTTSDAGATWSTKPALVPGNASLARITCWAAGSCRAISDARDNIVYTLAGGKWTKGAPVEDISNTIVDVSCDGPTTCVAVDNAGLTFYLDGTWKPGGPILGNGDVVNTLDGVVCSSGVCVAAGGGFVARSSEYGRSWDQGQSTQIGYASSMACGGGHCVVADQRAGAVDYDIAADAASGLVTVIDQRAGLNSVSCARNGSSCVAADDGRYVFARYGNVLGGQQAAFPVGQTVAGVSSADDDQCLAVSTSGQTLSWDAIAGWATEFGQIQDAEGNFPGYVAGVSCAGGAARTCVAMSSDTMWTFDAATPAEASAESLPASGYQLAGVSCTSAQQCVAVSSTGLWWRTGVDGTFGSSRTGLPQASVRGLSCATTSSCVAIDGDGTAYTLSGDTWTSKQLNPGTEFEGVSCPQAGACMVVDNGGRAYFGSGTSWVSDVVNADAPAMSGVSCATASDCTVVTGLGVAYRYTDAP